MADPSKPNESFLPEDHDDEDRKDTTHDDQAKRTRHAARRVVVQEHDTTKERTETIIGWAHGILDKTEDQHKSAQTGAEAAAAADTVFNFNNYYKDIAQQLKRQLDAKFHGTWHVITGKEFGSNVTCDGGSFINFKINNIYFLVLQSGPPEREGGEAVENDEKHMNDVIEADQ
ncbi:dynein light chain [Strigomonas culicis]|uniref:Dynein light chain n=1 Tax=Strigomonas culicis TaxID=28005 RepID=S9UCM7_9TRYP|nr:dynein light chain [Strigomonas culicis]|eukprot:EPY26663.1 dynein light chain [Strigomonas culicis]